MKALPDWVDTYITTLRETGLEGRARTAAHISKANVDRLYRADIEFQEAVDDARDKWADRLEAEAYRRGVEGIEKGIYYQGEKVDVERQYSDALLSQMLKAHRKALYGNETKITGAGAGGALTVNIRRFDEHGNPVEESFAAGIATGAAAQLDALSPEDLA